MPLFPELFPPRAFSMWKRAGTTRLRMPWASHEYCWACCSSQSPAAGRSSPEAQVGRLR